MRARWRLLFYAAIGMLVGMAMLAAAIDDSVSMWGWGRLLGMVIAAGFAGWADKTDFRKKWPAGVAVVAASPMLILVVQAIPHLGNAFDHVPIPTFVILGSTGFFVFQVVHILRSPIPAPARPPLAEARVVDSD